MRFIAILLCLLLTRCCAALAQNTTWDFENGPVKWKPRAQTITVTRVEGVGAAQSKASLRVQGKMEGGWNYAMSEQLPLKAGGLYRLSAWVRVDKIGATTPMPFLKCEFISSDPKFGGGRASTDACDRAKMGQWQQLTSEFKAPAGAEHGWIALETGSNGAVEIDAYLDTIALESIARLSALDKYRLNPIPAALQKTRGVHPRLYLNAARATQLRAAIKTTHAPLWEELRAQADKFVQSGPPPYRATDASGEEQLYQREVGNAMAALALAHVLSGEQKYLDSARAWALMSCSYPTWGLGRIDGMDLATGHQLFGLAIIYDWCHAGLGEPTRRTIRETLVKRTSTMFEAAASGRAWWHNSYLQNHLWVNICGMGAVGFALFDEVEDASMWIGLPQDKFRRTMDALGSDGASHEGVGYWGYGVEYMLKWMHLSRELLQVNLYDHQWWRRTAGYRQYLALPRKAWTRQNNIVDIADCPRNNWYGPDYLLRALAHEYRDGYAQWLAQQVDEENVDDPSARWLNLIWFDPAIATKAPTDLPTLRRFEDMDIVSARSHWSGNESLIVFKCGPFIGHEAIQHFSYDPGGGHVHPDANHFVLFGVGEWLLRDDGYRAKWTGQHNTLLINGRGQLGEGKQWFDGGAAMATKSRPRVLRATSTPQLDHIIGDATEAYPRELGLKKYQRHLLFLKPDVLIVLDDIQTERPQPLELRFHPESRELQRDGTAYLINGKQSTLRLQPLTLDGVTTATEDMTAQGRIGEKEFQMFTVRLNVQQPQWRNAIALSWSALDKKPVPVTLKSNGSVWTFTAAGRSVVFDWAASTARLSR